MAEHTKRGDMSWTTLSNKVVKIKKERSCYGCQVKYEHGTYMNKSVAVDDGDISSTYWCLPCEEFMRDKWGEADDGIGEGDCWEYRDYMVYRKQKVEQGYPEGTWPQWMSQMKEKYEKQSI